MKRNKARHNIEDNVPTKENSQEKLPETIELLKRTQASFENYRKQTEKRIKDMQEMAARQIIVQILPVLDNFTLALKNTQNPKEFVTGMELIYAQLNTLLEDNGVKPIIAEKQKFDPYLHEALMKVASKLPENVILEEFQKGYMLHEQVIRHARVKVSAGKNEEKESEEIERKEEGKERKE